jgi:hypothetical protein
MIWRALTNFWLNVVAAASAPVLFLLRGLIGF